MVTLDTSQWNHPPCDVTVRNGELEVSSRPLLYTARVARQDAKKAAACRYMSIIMDRISCEKTQGSLGCKIHFTDYDLTTALPLVLTTLIYDLRLLGYTVDCSSHNTVLTISW